MLKQESIDGKKALPRFVFIIVLNNFYIFIFLMNCKCKNSDVEQWNICLEG